ncbi:hypothetical protein PHYBOEH_004422 [Phytophthora boehmeriae]|uniref:Glucokinase n=1 Tax=Phytophthora boehmeriae TaxID=109152 RepID=A0A8T1WP56_9STRA|nr:hypothetical protein PHYBOEH_004422 [Phytophthora boehmeriae]
MVNTGTKLFAGVDIGATSVKIGNVAADGIIIYRVQQKLNPAELEPHDIVQFTSSLLTKLLTRMELRAQDLAGVGVGCPGVVLPGGVLHAAANFPSWSGVPLQRLLSDLIGIPVKVCNDADAAIMAEQWVGAAHGVKSFLMLILGTGVGFGVVDEGRLVRGGSNAIEGGHMIVERNGRQCGCSQRGCIEAYTSASALLREAREQLNSGVESALSSYPRDQMSVKLIFEQAAAGDKLCERLMNEVWL